MAFDAELVATVHLLLKGRATDAESAVQLRRLLDNREEFLAHLLVTEGLLGELPELAATIRRAAAAAYVAPGGQPEPPRGEPPLAAAVVAEVQAAQRALIAADLRNHDDLSALADADQRYRQKDEPFPFVGEKPFVPPVLAAPMPSRLRRFAQGVRRRARAVLGHR